MNHFKDFKLCSEGHVTFGRNDAKCKYCHAQFIFESDSDCFVECGQYKNHDGNVVKTFIPNKIVKLSNFRIYDNLIINNFIKIYRSYQMDRCDDFPNKFLKLSIDNGTARIEFCSDEFWKAVMKLLHSIEGKFDSPDTVSDVLIMRELMMLLDNDWV